MNAKKMIRLCKAAHAKLDELEGLLAYIPAEQDASRFVYESMADAKELEHVAKWETIHAVTVCQASHIHRILSRTDYYLNLVPDSVKNESSDGPE